MRKLTECLRCAAGNVDFLELISDSKTQESTVGGPEWAPRAFGAWKRSDLERAQIADPEPNRATVIVCGERDPAAIGREHEVDVELVAGWRRDLKAHRIDGRRAFTEMNQADDGEGRKADSREAPRQIGRRPTTIGRRIRGVRNRGDQSPSISNVPEPSPRISLEAACEQRPYGRRNSHPLGIDFENRRERVRDVIAGKGA